ncbi:hypothetical protein Rhe02_82370 [Rhizocola hellebori]|uniref:DUF4352 domain-containing protein n=1 Tax=Rhizocola hellebori TaxID=1392758 RepID=A0A8J3QG00_9ACTN|nr:hypothetical protein [Rhizocola hellebori]GIH10170.1 hypothetical protein Rhe02_82370 [Rhizocola hellebori]
MSRYDRLNEVEEGAPLFGEEAWVQMPDGSWVRATDKAAKKLKGKSKGSPPPEPDFIPAQSRKPEARASVPEAPAEPAPAAEPKRKFGRKSAADKQRQAELDRQAEQERETQRARRAELERERRAQADRDHQAELDRERLAEQELLRQAELERERKADLERTAALERARATELEREIELERARVARLEEEFERERQRQSDLEYERERQRRSRDELDPKTSTSVFGRWPDEKPVYPEPERWPDTSTDYRNSDSQYPEPASWPSVEPWSGSKSDSAAKPKPAPKPAPQPRRRTASRPPMSTGQRVTAVAGAVAMAAAAVAIGAGVRWLGPDPASSQRPFAQAGAPGESLDVRTFTITVQAARAASSLQAGGAAQATQGVWVIVRVRLAANHEPTQVGYAAVRDRAGRTYLASDRVRQPLIDGSRPFQPGIPIEGEVIFEVPKDALDSLTALFAAHPDRLALDAMAEVVLPNLTVAPGEQPPATLAPTEVKP